nr:hypothetical protein [Chlamydia poikilotherma]
MILVDVVEKIAPPFPDRFPLNVISPVLRANSQEFVEIAPPELSK